ncbi:MAG: YfhO family protein, partial [Lachnospiraceae bacterium]|nr:YfhO family protein [Lachnospiraceae bacterium]
MALLLVVLARRIYTSHTGLSDHTVVIGGLVFMSVCAVLHFLLIANKNARYRGFCICIWCAELLLFGMIMIGQPLYDSEYGSENEQEGEFIRITNDLVAGFGSSLETGQDAATFRIKNPDTSLNANYGMIMQRETLSGWTSFATQDQIDGAISLGYSSQFTRILDSGGTVFSDTLLHIRDIISHEELDDKLYEKVASADAVIDHMTGEKLGYNLYRNRFEMPFAIPVKDASKLEGTYDRVPDLINAYCEAFGGSPIASEITDTPDVKTVEGHEIYTYHIRADGRKTMYFCGDCVDCDYYNTSVAVNGKILTIASIKENDNNLFPAHFNNNTLELGSFENEEVDIVINKDIRDSEELYDHYLFEIDTDALSALCSSLAVDETVIRKRRGIDIEINGSIPDCEGLLVPIPYDDGWSAEADGEKVRIQNINGLFMYVPVQGAKMIHMSYFPPMMKSGAVISVIFLVLLLVTIYKDKRKAPAAGAPDRILGYTYIIAYCAAFTAIYAIPVLYALISCFTNLPTE